MSDVVNDPASLDSPFNACMFREMCKRHRDALAAAQGRVERLRALAARAIASVGSYDRSLQNYYQSMLVAEDRHE